MANRDISAALKKRASETAAEDDAFVETVYEEMFGPNMAKPSQQVQTLPLKKLRSFFTANIGFLPYKEPDLVDFAKDIEENGLLVKIKVRPIPDTEEYEILSGHNRVAACRRLGWSEIPAEIEHADDNRAIVIATVTNLKQRVVFLPSERGWAYRALMEAQKHQGKRTDLLEPTCAQNKHKSKTRDHVASIFGVDRNKIQRAIRLTYLIGPLLDAVDEKKLSLLCGESISCYDSRTQEHFLTLLAESSWKLSTNGIKQIKRLCPPPSIQAEHLREVWNAMQFPSSKPTSEIRLNRKSFEPYLEHLKNDTELEVLFLEFLKTRFPA